MKKQNIYIDVYTIDSFPKNGKCYLVIDKDGNMKVQNCPKGHRLGTWEKTGKKWYGSADLNFNPIYWANLPIPIISKSREISEKIESGWLIEATDTQKSLLMKMGYQSNMAPTYWTGVNEQTMMKHRHVWTQEVDEAIRFSRKIDADMYILGLGYSLDNPWIRATEHIWL